MTVVFIGGPRDGHRKEMSPDAVQRATEYFLPVLPKVGAEYAGVSLPAVPMYTSKYMLEKLYITGGFIICFYRWDGICLGDALLKLFASYPKEKDVRK
jgi:hypothetical protein